MTARCLLSPVQVAGHPSDVKHDSRDVENIVVSQNYCTKYLEVEIYLENFEIMEILEIL